MNGLELALSRLRTAEEQLETALRATASVHRDEAEVRHVARDLAGWSSAHVVHIGLLADEEGMHLTEQASPQALVVGAVDDRADQPAGRLTLLEDLLQVYLLASQVSLRWEMVAQIAKATRMAAVSDLVTDCHPQTVRQIQWATTMVKTLSPQILATQ
jgi:hypothetical protein